MTQQDIQDLYIATVWLGRMREQDKRNRERLREWEAKRG